MPLSHIVSAMIQERDRLDQAIEILKSSHSHRETATQGAGARRGMSLASRKAQSQRMKLFWAAKQKAAKKA